MGTFFRQSAQDPVQPVIAFSPEECLALIIDLRLSQRQYKRLRKNEKKNGAKLLVTWDKIRIVKKQCEPENIKKDVLGEVSVPLQDCVDHQAQEIMDLPDVKAKYEKLVESGQDFEFVMFGKYGYDGTQTKTEYYTADAGIILCYIYLGCTLY